MAATKNSSEIDALKRYLQNKWEMKYSISHSWFISFLKEYKYGENYKIYERVLNRTVLYGNKYMKNCPILSIVLQLLFEGIDDLCLKEKQVFDNLWFTVTNDGLQSIKKYSYYIDKSVMNKQLNRQSTLFQALREYYRQNVFLFLKESNITNKQNLYELALDDVADQGWLSDLKSIEKRITPKHYKAVLEKFRFFHQKKKSQRSKKSKTKAAHQIESSLQLESTSKTTSKKKKRNVENNNSLYCGLDEKEKEKEIFKFINQHRQQHGLPPLEASANLAYVARTHAVDVVENTPDVNGGNTHSWSDKGNWTPVIYTPDHRYASLMWNKPSEISNYKFRGYEISYGYSKSSRKTATINPQEAVNAWKNSPGHNVIMVQQGVFHHLPMKAMGVGVYKGYACTWFGQERDTFPAPT